jgi:hypothetical protein
LKRPNLAFDIKEVDISLPENQKWSDLYQFDIPVGQVSYTKAGTAEEVTRGLFMHRVNEEEVEKRLLDAAKDAASV